MSKDKIKILNMDDRNFLLREGEWMNGFSPECAAALLKCEDLCFQLNSTLPSNISIGENFVGNFNLTILDEAKVTIGNNVFIGPNTTICTIIHAYDAPSRNEGIMCARSVRICDNVWIAANVIVLPGVTIGEGAVIGAGSVVTKGVAPYTIVAGNPARVVRKIPNGELLAFT